MHTALFHIRLALLTLGAYNIPKNLISDVQMRDGPVVFLIALTNTVSDILMKQFGHANGHEMGSESCVLETEFQLVVQNSSV